jgi:catechol 2,3-dioxygenase-like lactoylglutathione lyase family enzyme
MKTRFVHLNLVARDWRALASFYQQVFGCEIVPPLRDYAGPHLEAGTGISAARLQGAHLRLPGYREEGPTLEIFQYTPDEGHPPTPVNRHGYGHIAFAVDDVRQARETVISSGGTAVGDVVTLSTADGRQVTWAYVRDPEDNIIELQSWSG